MDTETLIEEKNEEIYKLKQKIAMTEQVKIELEFEKESLISQIQLKSDQHLQMENKFKALQLQYEEELMDLDTLMNDLNEKISSGSKSKNINNTELNDKLKFENKETNSIIQDLEFENTNLQSELKSFQEENYETQLKKENLRKHLTMIEEKLKDAKTVLESKEKQFANTVELRNELQDKIMSLEIDLEAVKSTITKNSKGNSLFGEVDERCTKMKQEIETAEIALEEYKKKCDSKSKECKKLMDENIEKCKLLSIRENEHIQRQGEMLALHDSFLNELQVSASNGEDIENVSLFKFESPKDEKLVEKLKEIELDLKKQIKECQSKMTVYAIKDYHTIRKLFELKCELLSTEIKILFAKNSSKTEI